MKSFKFLLLTIALFLYGFITVVTCAAVWNADTKAVLDVAAGLLFALNAFVIYRKAMALSDQIKKNGITN